MDRAEATEQGRATNRGRATDREPKAFSFRRRCLRSRRMRLGRLRSCSAAQRHAVILSGGLCNRPESKNLLSDGGGQGRSFASLRMTTGGWGARAFSFRRRCLRSRRMRLGGCAFVLPLPPKQRHPEKILPSPQNDNRGLCRHPPGCLRQEKPGTRRPFPAHCPFNRPSRLNRCSRTRCPCSTAPRTNRGER